MREQTSNALSLFKFVVVSRESDISQTILSMSWRSARYIRFRNTASFMEDRLGDILRDWDANSLPFIILFNEEKSETSLYRGLGFLGNIRHYRKVKSVLRLIILHTLLCDYRAKRAMKLRFSWTRAVPQHRTGFFSEANYAKYAARWWKKVRRWLLYHSATSWSGRRWCGPLSLLAPLNERFLSRAHFSRLVNCQPIKGAIK